MISNTFYAYFKAIKFNRGDTPLGKIVEFRRGASMGPIGMKPQTVTNRPNGLVEHALKRVNSLTKLKTFRLRSKKT